MDQKRKKTNSSNVEGVKEISLTFSQAQQKVINDRKFKKNYKNALKVTCRLFQMESSKTGKGKKELPKFVVMKLARSTILQSVQGQCSIMYNMTAQQNPV